MSITNYFGEWNKVINQHKLRTVLTRLDKEYALKVIYPDKNKVFRAFNICPYSELKVVMIGQDPYPQKGVATGILFGNNTSDNISPSLQVIKDTVLRDNAGVITFDHTLESWAKQGCLMINAALTVEAGYIGSHTMLWRPFITSLLQNLSEINSGIIYVLFGSNAHTFAPYIGKNNYVFKYKHPAYAVRTQQEYECDAFKKINQILINNHGTAINWYYDIN